ncbi:hypothetical protein SVAN01_02723 [Stagonosporopsis vannaccii]|nr:hypothetical protein SVAN01_02723 [Stagonosporopsis vannaccii]
MLGASTSEQPAATAARPYMGRQTKACKSCRSLKIKCIRSDSNGPCRRCRSRGLDCQVESNPQAVLLEQNDRWRNNISGRVQQLQTAVDVLLRMSDLPLLSSYAQAPLPAEDTHSQHGRSGRNVQESDEEETLPPAPILTPVAPLDNSIYSLPINSLYEITRLPTLGTGPASPSTQRNHLNNDFISRGLISEAVAEQFFARFIRLDYYCYGLMCPYNSLADLRANSPVLTAAICAVAALHDPEGSPKFRVCHAEFQRLVMAGMFVVSQPPDTIRALIIGAYWLADISYTLLGHAIRLAMRLNYHLAYYSVMKGPQPDDIMKARLWYILYIHDHQSSIFNGRPALISSSEEPHQQWEAFIRINGNEEVDLRMSSQIALYHITSKVKDVFGSDPSQSVPEHSLPQLRGYFSELDRWYMVWGNRMPRNYYVGWFPRDGAILNYHFGRLHLCSYVFRGSPLTALPSASAQAQEYASIAVTSATAVLELINDRDDLRSALVGMPIYYHAMVNFAAVFLIKAAKIGFPDTTAVKAQDVLALVDKCVRQLRAQKASSQHLVHHLANGLEGYMNMLSDPNQDMSMLAGPTATLGDAASLSNTVDSIFMLDTFDLFSYVNT